MSAAEELAGTQQASPPGFGDGVPPAECALDLVCRSAGAERTVFVDDDGRVDVWDCRWSEVM